MLEKHTECPEEHQFDLYITDQIWEVINVEKHTKTAFYNNREFSLCSAGKRRYLCIQ